MDNAKLFHPTKGSLTKKKRYNPLTNKAEEFFVDSSGKPHKLDGTEFKPEEKIKEKEETEIQDEMESQKRLEEMDKEEMEMEMAMREDAKKQSHKEEKAKMHSEVVREVKNASEAIVESIKAIPETIIPEYPDHSGEIIEAIKSTIKEDKEIDLSLVVKAIEKIPEVKIPEAKDYTKLLEEIKKALPKDADMSGVVEAISKIPEPKEVPFKFNKEGRLTVEVDRISMPGGGSLDTSLLATEETLQAVLAAQGGSVYNYIQSALDATYKYYGYASSTGWKFKRKTLATGVWEVAEGAGDYDTAFSDRENKTYGYTI